MTSGCSMKLVILISPWHLGQVRGSVSFIRYAMGHEGVWIARCQEIARWWLERYGELQA